MSSSCISPDLTFSQACPTVVELAASRGTCITMHMPNLATTAHESLDACQRSELLKAACLCCSMRQISSMLESEIR